MPLRHITPCYTPCPTALVLQSSLPSGHLVCLNRHMCVCVCVMERIFGVHASPHLTLTGVRETYGKTEGEEGERRWKVGITELCTRICSQAVCGCKWSFSTCAFVLMQSYDIVLWDATVVVTHIHLDFFLWKFQTRTHCPQDTFMVKAWAK